MITTFSLHSCTLCAQKLAIHEGIRCSRCKRWYCLGEHFVTHYAEKHPMRRGVRYRTS